MSTIVVWYSKYIFNFIRNIYIFSKEFLALYITTYNRQKLELLHILANVYKDFIQKFQRRLRSVSFG